MKTIEVVTVIALVLGPLLGAWYTTWNQSRSDRRAQQRWVMNALIQHRANIYAEDRIKALALVDVAFYRHKSVRAEWAEYYTMVNNAGLNDGNGGAIREAKYMDLIVAMAQVLGYGRTIGHGDLLRKYSPQGLATMAESDAQTKAELLRVLRNTQSIGIVPRDPKDVTPIRPTGTDPL